MTAFRCVIGIMKKNKDIFTEDVTCSMCGDIVGSGEKLLDHVANEHVTTKFGREYFLGKGSYKDYTPSELRDVLIMAGLKSSEVNKLTLNETRDYKVIDWVDRQKHRDDEFERLREVERRVKQLFFLFGGSGALDLVSGLRSVIKDLHDDNHDLVDPDEDDVYVCPAAAPREDS